MSHMLAIFSLPNLWWVLGGAALLGATLGAVGAYCFLKRESLVGDVLSHAALPGVTTAFLILQSRHPAVILGGALISCGLTNVLLHLLNESTRLKIDAILALLLSGSFAVGMFQLSLIQQMPGAQSAGLDRLLFGQAAALRYEDLVFYLWVSSVMLFLLWIFSRELSLSIFDPQFGKTIGIPVVLYRTALAGAAAIAVAISLDLAGVVLVAALLITPAAAARLWTRSITKLVCIAAIIGAVSGISGSLVSSLKAGMPTGPWIVVAATVLFLVSVAFAPSSGMLPRYLKRRKLKTVIAKENILRSSYRYLEQKKPLGELIPHSFLQERRSHTPEALRRLVTTMQSEGLLKSVESNNIRLSESGLRIAEKLTRYHRLWELYLSTHVMMPETHLHADAEEAEHFLDENLAEALEATLPDAAIDPHGSPIPTLGSKEDV